MKKSFWDTRLWRILNVAINMIIKNQKGIKGTDNEKKIDDIFKS